MDGRWIAWGRLWSAIHSILCKLHACDTRCSIEGMSSNVIVYTKPACVQCTATYRALDKVIRPF